MAAPTRRWPRHLRQLNANTGTLTDQQQPHADSTGTLGPPVVDVEQARLDYAQAAQHASTARPRPAHAARSTG